VQKYLQVEKSAILDKAAEHVVNNDCKATKAGT